jgi:Cu(I)/Ag(I) efflux system periplasmic protein CusF
MHPLSKLTLAMVMAAASAFAGAQESTPAAHGTHPEHAARGARELTDGEVKKIDKEAGKITLRHGEIRNLGMAPMTMVLRVREPAMLDQVKVGDKVRFAADRLEGAITVVQLEKAE